MGEQDTGLSVNICIKEGMHRFSYILIENLWKDKNWATCGWWGRQQAGYLLYFVLNHESWVIYSINETEMQKFYFTLPKVTSVYFESSLPY